MARQKKDTPHIDQSARDRIIVRGARVHNLKNIDIDLPRKKLIVVTGVSGSGKSSLAFDTIYAEGQRRYVESLSSYARQFLERMDKPDVDLIQGISPAMAIEQKSNTKNPRSTVGTSTEIYDYLRLLYARAGRTFCSKCGKLVGRDSVRTVQSALTSEMEALNKAGSVSDSLKLYVTFPLPVHSGEPLAEALTNLKTEGFFRLIVGDQLIDLNESTPRAGTKSADVRVLVDRLVFKVGEIDTRLADSIETAFACGRGRAEVILTDQKKILVFDQDFVCSICQIVYEEPDPRLFSFNNPFGACPECQGFGRSVGIDLELVIPNRRRTICDNAIQPWSTPIFKKHLSDLYKIAKKENLRVDIPMDELTDQEWNVVLNGIEGFAGIYGFFKEVEKKTYKMSYRFLLSRYRGYTTCEKCKGSRLRPAALDILVDGKNIGDVVRMTVEQANQFFRDLVLSETEMTIAKRILEELRKRLSYLNEVGIGYLTLDRLSSTLSGGEAQRINLATSLGSSLVGALYVLDEPSIGLHPRDNEKLITILKALRDVGNTVLVVEHDSDMMRASDILVDMGPRAGELGGEVIFVGPPEDIVGVERSLTGKYLSGKMKIPIPSTRRISNGVALQIRGAAENNLRKVDVDIPLQMFVCVTGVSGSGKSSLIHDVLYAGLKKLKDPSSESPGKHESIEGAEIIGSVELVDQSPIGRSPRSNPVTYIQVFDHIRKLFSSTQAAKVHGFTPGHFSFNIPGGRCEACEGDGVVKVEMQFLADLYLICDVCKGKRYKKEVLAIQYRGKTIDDVLALTVTEAIQFFKKEPSGRKVAEKLGVLEDVGLGYIRLGQPATSLSGGEAQRVKLAGHLNTSSRGHHTLFIFDEPTTGLHFDDIAKLVRCFDALIEAGNSVIIIEHNLDVIKCADHIIDMGPEAGDGGGLVVASGTPEELAKEKKSHTGRFLRSCLSV